MQQQEEQQLAHASDGALYDRHGAIILAYARSRTASWQDAEDLTLEVFVTALEHENLTWLSPRQQLVWLWRVAHNTLVDSYRRPLQPATVPLEHVVEQAYRDEALSLEEPVLRREELAWLSQAVGKLAPQERQVLQLRLGAGLRFAEIAILMHRREAGWGKSARAASRACASRMHSNRKECRRDRPDRTASRRERRTLPPPPGGSASPVPSR